jgi:hypothetical protein
MDLPPCPLSPTAGIQLNEPIGRNVPQPVIAAMQQNAGVQPYLLDHLVGALLEKQRYFDAECLGGLEIQHHHIFGG